MIIDVELKQILKHIKMAIKLSEEKEVLTQLLAAETKIKDAIIYFEDDYK